MQPERRTDVTKLSVPTAVYGWMERPCVTRPTAASPIRITGRNTNWRAGNSVIRLPVGVLRWLTRFRYAAIAEMHVAYSWRSRMRKKNGSGPKRRPNYRGYRIRFIRTLYLLARPVGMCIFPLFTLVVLIDPTFVLKYLVLCHPYLTLEVC